MNYNTKTVKELKVMTKDRPVFVDGPRKADYVKALVDDDRYKLATKNFQDKLKNDVQAIKDTRAKFKNACTILDTKIKSLKDKNDKTIDDYEELVIFLEQRMSLMKDIV